VQLAGTSACPSVGHFEHHGTLGAIELQHNHETYRTNSSFIRAAVKLRDPCLQYAVQYALAF
jgi:hypothetical protein